MRISSVFICKRNKGEREREREREGGRRKKRGRERMGGRKGGEEKEREREDGREKEEERGRDSSLPIAHKSSLLNSITGTDRLSSCVMCMYSTIWIMHMSKLKKCISKTCVNNKIHH